MTEKEKVTETKPCPFLAAFPPVRLGMIAVCPLGYKAVQNETSR